MAKLNFQIVTPERTLLNEQIDSLTCPTTTGEITVLPNHIPLISSLQSGELVAKNGDKTEYFAVSGGFVEVRPGSNVVVLADTAEHYTEIDEARAEEAKMRAQELMRKASQMSSAEYAKLFASLQKNLARIKVARRSHRGHYGVGSEGILKDRIENEKE
ncbi:F0F1 ATP synthase subunit epsilon [Patescibacteria group bacterium]|nr:F0F1 ATP synthase subunit epsilon [Patescibacteria group bacterium]